MWGAIVLFGSIVLAVTGYLRVNRNPSRRTAPHRPIVAQTHRPQPARPRRPSPQPGRRLRPSRMPATPWGRLAYLWAAYVAHAAFTVRDVRLAAATAWRDVGTTHSPQPTPPTTAQPQPVPAQLADDLAVFAESRAAVAALTYVAPPAAPLVKTPVLNGEPAAEPGTERELAPEPTPEPLSFGRQKAIAEALQTGLTATQIAALLGGRKQTALAEIAEIRKQWEATRAAA